MKVRKANTKDIDQVYELCKNPALLNPSWEPPKKWWIEAFVKEDQIFFVAEEDNKIIWFILWERTTWNIWYLWMISVREDHRGKWIWNLLLNKVQEECIKRWLKVIIAYAYEWNPTISNMLDFQGFETWELFRERVKFL